jgi:hypothetical protein
MKNIIEVKNYGDTLIINTKKICYFIEAIDNKTIVFYNLNADSINISYNDFKNLIDISGYVEIYDIDEQKIMVNLNAIYFIKESNQNVKIYSGFSKIKDDNNNYLRKIKTYNNKFMKKNNIFIQVNDFNNNRLLINKKYITTIQNNNNIVSIYLDDDIEIDTKEVYDEIKEKLMQ